MKNSELILTSDYELFGNGSGNVTSCIIEPSNRMMDVSEKHGFKICFYVDVCEIWAFENEENHGSFKDNYQPAKLIKEHLLEICKRGHDIQLHLHPQWVNYNFNREKQNWDLDYSLWRLAEVENLDFGIYGKGTYGLLNKGKKWLENLIQPVDSKYKCQSFRAGAWCIQPEEKIIKALKKLNFTIESSTAPGMVFNGKLTQFNFQSFTDLPNNWPLGNKLNEINEKSTLIEVPIATAFAGILEQTYFTILKRLRKNPSSAINCNAEKANKESLNLSEKFRRYILPGYRMLDFASGSTFEEMKYITLGYIKRLKSDNVKVVAISHPKNFGDSTEFDNFLSWWNSTFNSNEGLK